MNFDHIDAIFKYELETAIITLVRALNTPEKLDFALEHLISPAHPQDSVKQRIIRLLNNLYSVVVTHCDHRRRYEEVEEALQYPLLRLFELLGDPASTRAVAYGIHYDDQYFNGFDPLLADLALLASLKVWDVYDVIDDFVKAYKKEKKDD